MNKMVFGGNDNVKGETRMWIIAARHNKANKVMSGGRPYYTKVRRRQVESYRRVGVL